MLGFDKWQEIFFHLHNAGIIMWYYMDVHIKHSIYWSAVYLLEKLWETSDMCTHGPPPHCLTKDAELWRHVLLSCSALSVSQYPQGVWSKRSFSSPQEERYPPSDVTISYIYLYLLFYYALKLHIFYLFDIFFFNYFFFVALKAEQCCLTACSLAQSTNAYHGTHNEGYTC